MCPTSGVYPAADVKDAGDQISSTYEGRHVTLYEGELVHPEHADVYVDKGDPVVFGAGLQGVGVAFMDGVAITDLIAIDTEGIWVLDVVASDDDGASAVAVGDLLCIDTVTAVISKIRSTLTAIPFGYALGTIASGTKTIAVKIHFDPKPAGTETYEAIINLSAVDIKAMYATPVELIAAIAGKGIVVESYDLKLILTATAFTGGGDAEIEYGSTVHAGGTKAISTTISAGLIRMTEGVWWSLVSATGAIGVDEPETIINVGIYISNISAAFAAGTGAAAVLRIRYHLI